MIQELLVIIIDDVLLISPAIFPPIVVFVMLVIIIVSFPVTFCAMTKFATTNARLESTAARMGRIRISCLRILILLRLYEINGESQRDSKLL
jgi:hypothetical protein